MRICSDAAIELNKYAMVCAWRYDMVKLQLIGREISCGNICFFVFRLFEV